MRTVIALALAFPLLATIDYYRIKSPFGTFTGSQKWCQQTTTSG